MEIRRLARDQEVPHVTVGDQDLSACLGAVFTLLVRDYEQLDRGFALHVPQILDGAHHRGEGALHIVDATGVELVPRLPRLELRLLARHYINVAVKQDPRFPRPRPRVARRLQPPRPEPAVDKVDRGLCRARRVRPVAHKLLRERKDLSVLGCYRQKIPLFSDTIRAVYSISYGESSLPWVSPWQSLVRCEVLSGGPGPLPRRRRSRRGR